MAPPFFSDLFGYMGYYSYFCTHENPPSLSLMLKSAGRSIFIQVKEQAKQ